MPDLWLPGVTRLESTRRITMRGTGERICTWHSFEAGYTLTALRGAQYLIDQASEAHFVLHPVTGELVQLLPLDTGARTLVYDATRPTIKTNSHGSTHVQIEVIGYAAQPFTNDLTDAGKASLGRLMAYLRSWGIPDVWCGGVRPPTYPGPGVPRVMPLAGVSGHTAHAVWQSNSHGDPGRIADPWSFAPAPAPTPPPAPKPDKTLATRVQTLLLALGYDLAPWGVDGAWGPTSQAALDTYRADFGRADTGYPTTAHATTLEADVAKIDDLLTQLGQVQTTADATALSLTRLDERLSADDRALWAQVDAVRVELAKPLSIPITRGTAP